MSTKIRPHAHIPKTFSRKSDISNFFYIYLYKNWYCRFALLFTFFFTFAFAAIVSPDTVTEWHSFRLRPLCSTLSWCFTSTGTIRTICLSFYRTAGRNEALSLLSYTMPIIRTHNYCTTKSCQSAMEITLNLVRKRVPLDHAPPTPTDQTHWQTDLIGQPPTTHTIQNGTKKIKIKCSAVV